MELEVEILGLADPFLSCLGPSTELLRVLLDRSLLPSVDGDVSDVSEVLSWPETLDFFVGFLSEATPA